MLSFHKEDIEEYCSAHSSGESDLYRRLAEETRAKTDLPQMMVGNQEGLLLRSLVRMMGARRVLEIGTFTGYSAMAMSEGLPDDGKIITCDIDPHATGIAQQFWNENPHGHKIELRLGPALETIAAINEDIDLVFIDADKQNYSNYWDAVVPKVRKGGAIVADNVLWSGRVLKPADEETKALVAFSKHVSEDPRVEHVMLPIRDGIMLSIKL